MARSAYLGLLWVLGLPAWQATVGWNRAATLGDTSRFGLLLFEILVLYVQLPLLLFFAALSAASAVAQEKDRRTFVLLLITDLRNHEIVLGKLLGSLLQIVLLLAGTVPILAMLLLLGGIDVGQVVQAVVILATASLAAASLGSLMALWRDKTFPALALTVLFLVLYLCLVRVPAVLSAVFDWFPHLEQWPSIQLWLDPYLALQSVLNPPVAEQTAIAPAFGFAGTMLLLTALINLWGIVRLRVWNPSGEPIIQREQPDALGEEKDRLKAHAAPGLVRQVWRNPILWREMRTRAYGRRPALIKIAYLIVLALVGYYALSPIGEPGGKVAFAAAYGLVPVTILSLLLVASQAVTAITSERDGGALDLLLVTDLTPQEFNFGKLGGIGYNCMLYLLPPLALAGIYAHYGWLASAPRGHGELLASKNTESAICVAVAVLLLLVFTMVLGVHVALRNENSRAAVTNSLGTVFFLSVGTLVCIYLILINGRFEYQWLSFIGFIFAGVAGLWWVLSADRPSAALTLASWLCPFAVFYAVTNILVAKPGSEESTDPLMPFLVIATAFGFTVAAMLVPLLSEFDVALGRTTGGGE